MLLNCYHLMSHFPLSFCTFFYRYGIMACLTSPAQLLCSFFSCSKSNSLLVIIVASCCLIFIFPPNAFYGHGASLYPSFTLLFHTHSVRSSESSQFCWHLLCAHYSSFNSLRMLYFYLFMPQGVAP